MIKLLWRTDVHLSDKTPSKRTGIWTNDVLDKLKWIGDLAKEIDADLVLDGGDFFDVKSPHKNSHSLVRSTIDIHNGYPCPTYALVGNHDVKYGKIDFLPQQPLGVLFASKTFLPFNHEKPIIIEKDNIKVKILGVAYHGVEYDYDMLSNIKKGDEDYLIVCCHLLATQGNSTTMFEGEDIVGYDFLNSISDVDCWCFGHWHKDQGISHLENGAVVINVGSLTRGSLHLDDLNRKPCTVEINVSDKGLSYIRHDLPVRPVNEAFKVDQKVYEIEDKERMIEIVEKMKNVATQGWSDLSLKERIKQSGLSNEVIEKTLSYLD